MTIHPGNPEDSEAVPPDDALRSSLSALMDGEASELEMQRLFKRMEFDDAMRAQWSRYQQVASVIRHREVVAPVSLDLANRVRQALDDEASVARPSSLWQKNIARIAVAASVAVVVITGAQWQRQAPGEKQVAVIPATAVMTAAVATAQPVDEAVLHKIELLGKPDIFSKSSPEFAVNVPPLLASQPMSAARMQRTATNSSQVPMARSASQQGR